MHLLCKPHWCLTVAGSLEVVSAVCRQVWAAGGICTTVANFPAFERGLQAGLAGRVTTLDTVPYRQPRLGSPPRPDHVQRDE